MVTIEQLRKPANISGFAHVGLVEGPSRPGKRAYYQAYEKGGRKGDWKGPARATAEEAAQDYCARANGGQLAPPSEPRLKSAGHAGTRAVPEIPTDIEAAYGMIRDYRAQQAGKNGYVYLIIESMPGGGLHYGKIGFSTNPRARVRELQTGNPRTLKLHASKPGTLEDERALHDRHLEKNVLQEWFLIDKALLLEWDADEIVKEEV